MKRRAMKWLGVAVVLVVVVEGREGEIGNSE
jgi:hypothetical protein